MHDNACFGHCWLLLMLLRMPVVIAITARASSDNGLKGHNHSYYAQYNRIQHSYGLGMVCACVCVCQLVLLLPVCSIKSSQNEIRDQSHVLSSIDMAKLTSNNNLRDTPSY